MNKFAKLTIKALVRERGFFIIASLCLLFLCVPVFSSFSMRQCQEVGISMCLTINSFMLLILTIFSGISTMWKDIEKKTVYTLLSYPVARSEYLLGRFLGCGMLLLIITIFDIIISIPIIKACAGMYKSSLPIKWSTIIVAYFMSLLKYILLLSISFVAISISTSFFTPFFITIASYIGGNSIQSIYDYIFKEASKNYPFWFKKIVKLIYYVMPNFSSFDLTAYAAYSLKVNLYSVGITCLYATVYSTVMLSLSCIIFSKRDLL